MNRGVADGSTIVAYRVYLAIAGTVFLASGVFAFFDPHAMGGALGIAPVDGSGVTEIRATYGGLVVGSGLLAAWGVFSERLATAALACILFCGGGLVLTRIISELFFGGPGISLNQGVVIVFELALIGFASYQLRRLLRRQAARDGAVSAVGSES